MVRELEQGCREASVSPTPITYNASGQKVSAPPAPTVNPKAGTAVSTSKPVSSPTSSSNTITAPATGATKPSASPTSVTYNASGQKVSAPPTPTVNTRAGTTSTTSSSPTYLRRGSSGEDVRQLQQMLASEGYKATIDGKFSPQTGAAVRRFQKDHGLTVNGIVGH